MFTATMTCPCDIHRLVSLTDKLNSKTVQKINDTQELVMVNDFARETNESLFMKSLADRMSDIESWRWVLEDLTKRLEEAINGLKYELKAIRVVGQRVKDEIYEHSKKATRPGALCPASDAVEDAIKEEGDFLHEQKKSFEGLVEVIEKQISMLYKTKARIRDDILNKNETLQVEENCKVINLKNLSQISIKKRKKARPTSLTHWENRCRALKEEGLKALSKALCTRQQARGARVQLTIVSQGLANKVDAAIRKRMHINHAKLQELDWQKQEALKDLQSLDEEMRSTEQGLLSNMEQERVVEARLADRSQRPSGELTRDDVDKKLKNELARVRRFIRDLRCNLNEINSLQNYLKDTIVRMDCLAEDIITVLKLDEERIQGRQAGAPTKEASATAANVSPPSANKLPELKTIKEENEDIQDDENVGDEFDDLDEEEDDYPFDD